MAAAGGAKVFVFDPWNELDHEPRKNQQMTHYIADALRQLKQYAQDLGIHLCMVAHPRKVDGVPQGYAISDSAHWMNRPDLGFTVHRTGDMTDVLVWKVRFQEDTGTAPGACRFNFDRANGVFRNSIRISASEVGNEEF